MVIIREFSLGSCSIYWREIVEYMLQSFFRYKSARFSLPVCKQTNKQSSSTLRVPTWVTEGKAIGLKHKTQVYFTDSSRHQSDICLVGSHVFLTEILQSCYNDSCNLPLTGDRAGGDGERTGVIASHGLGKCELIFSAFNTSDHQDVALKKKKKKSCTPVLPAYWVRRPAFEEARNLVDLVYILTQSMTKEDTPRDPVTRVWILTLFKTNDHNRYLLLFKYFYC